MPVTVPSIFEKTLESSLCHASAPYRAETIGKDRYLQHITEYARLARAAKSPGSRQLLKRFASNKRHIAQVCRGLAKLSAQEEAMPSGSEWLLDNQYVIEAIVKEIETDLPQGYYHELPTLKSGSWHGYPRVYELAIALLAHADSSLSEEIIRESVEKYQEMAPLTIGELWALPTMLRLGLLENLRRLADRVMGQVNDSHAAKEAVQLVLSHKIPSLPSHPSGTYASTIWEELRENDLPAGQASMRLQSWSNEHLADIAHIQHAEFCLQAADQVSIGNAITSLRLLGVVEWSKFVESVSLVDRILQKDAVYSLQDFSTRNQCRRVIERLSRTSRRTEVEVAQSAMTLAQAKATHSVQGQVSYWLLDDGYDALLESLSTTHRPVTGDFRRWTLKNPNTVYFGLLFLFLTLGLPLLGWAIPWQPLSWLILLPAAIPLSEVAVLLTNQLIARLLPPRQLARYEWKSGIPEECSTMVVIPALVNKPEHATNLLERLEQHYLANPDPQLWFALLTDFCDASSQATDHDDQLIKHLLNGVAQLNARYHSEENSRFFVFHRKRLWNPSENCWMGWERKRGKLDEFNRLLRGDTSTSYSVQSSSMNQLPKIRYVLTLDADTVLPRDAARQMIARLAHPLNHAELADDGRRVVRGYGVLQPRVSFLFRTGFCSLFARWFAGSTGIDPYSAAASDTYMDLFGKGSFTGKGLYDVDAFSATAGQAFPENRILSHDLIESNYARCALATDVEVFDDFPASYLTYARREHRWIRGDWQLLQWLMPRVPTPKGALSNILPGLERWKIIDNLRRSLVAPASFLLIVASLFLGLHNYRMALVVAVLPYLFPLVHQLIAIVSHSLFKGTLQGGLRQLRTDLSNTLGQTVVQLTMLPHLASVSIDAITRTLYRMFLSKRKLLEWETSSSVEGQHQNTLIHSLRVLLPTMLVVLGVSLLLFLTHFNMLLWASPLLLVWLLSPVMAYLVSRPIRPKQKPLDAADQKFLEAIIGKTWHFFETFVGETDHWLPPDNYQEFPCGSVAHRTSPTNIGVYLLCTLTAHHFHFLALKAMLKRLNNAFDTLEGLPRHQGHFFNWYDTRTLTTLRPEYVSTVDSGNLLACLLALKNGLLELSNSEELTDHQTDLRRLADRAHHLAEAMDFRFLYNTERELFSIGLNVDLNRLDSNHYDLLASEACIASFLTIAYGQVPRKHWFHLGRMFTQVGRFTGLVSWGGTMFEYLMPRLLLPVTPGILLEQAQQAAVERQRAYGQEINLPWGISESAYYAFDDSQQYQYQSFGVPKLGLKRGLSRDRVIAPYATLLAVDVAPREAIANLRRITREGGEGEYGYYEAIDYTSNRISPGSSKEVIRTYMAHHQGMGLLSIANCLRQGMIRSWLHAEPAVRSAELLLEERVPHDAPVLPTEANDVEQQVSENPVQSRRRIVTADTPSPRTHLISNGRYSVMVTNAGTGFSRLEHLDITRWRANPTSDRLGTFIYLRNRREGTLWSTTHQPVIKHADEFEVIYAVDKADFHRRDEDVDTLMEVTVVPDTDVEIRRITLMNLGRRSKHLDVTSYAEVVLGTTAEDQAHPAFGKLFLETEWLPQYTALLCRRRPRSPEQKPVWAVHVLAVEDRPGSISYETDRGKFLGRRRDVSDPLAMEPSSRHLSGSTGAVLDPIFSIRRSLKIRPGERAVLAYTTGYAESREAALALADRFHALPAVHRGFELAWAHTRIDLQHAHLEADDVHLFQKLAGHLLFPVGPLRSPAEIIAANTLGQSGLWSYGISGDLPLAVIRLHGLSGMGHLKQMLQAHEYWRKKGLRAELLVLCENAGGYYDESFTEAVNQVRSIGMGDWLDKPAGIFVRKGGQMPEADRTLLLSCAQIVVDDRAGPIHLQGANPLFSPNPPMTTRPHRSVASRFTPLVQNTISALPNTYGGFSADELEYVIKPNVGEKIPPLPWSNVVANPAGGFLITDSGGGFSWVGNSQLNRLTPWSNDPIADPPGEAIYLQDLATGAQWNPTPLPIRDDGEVTVSHGQGYTSFQRIVNDISHDLTLAMPEHDPVKISTLKLRNRGSKPVRLAITYYVEWVLGTHRGVTLPHVVTFLDGPSNKAMFARNAYNPDYPEGIAFAATNLENLTSTGNRAEFLGRNHSLADPGGLRQDKLSGQVGRWVGSLHSSARRDHHTTERIEDYRLPFGAGG
ncbi:MAG: glucoamylase family protein [Gemmatales bacterium]